MALVCDICGGGLEVGVGGLASCSDCGMKYTQERLQEKVQQVRGTVTIDQSQSATNFLELANHALESGNLAEAEGYATKLIEIDPQNSKGWLIKGQAAGWQSSLRSIRLLEAANAFAKAIDLSPGEETEAMRDYAADQLGSMSVAVIELRGSLFTDHPDADQIEGFQSDLASVQQAVDALRSRTNIEVAALWERIASAVAEAAVGAWNKTILPDFTRDQYPNDWERDRFGERTTTALRILGMAVDISNDDSAADVKRYKNMIVLSEHLRDSKSYKWTANGHVVSQTLTKEAKRLNNEAIARYRGRISAIETEEKQRKQQAAKADAQAKLDAQWAGRSEEREQALAEHKRLTTVLEGLRRKADQAARRDELAGLLQQIRELDAEINSMGMFKRAERKALQERLDSLRARRDDLSTQARAEEANFSKEIKSIEAQVDSLAATLFA